MRLIRLRVFSVAAVQSPEQTSDSAVAESPILLGSEDTALE